MAISLSTKNVTKYFGGIKALSKVSVDFERGKITALIGPNGSGKSTLANCLAGFHEIYSGQVVVNNKIKLKTIDPKDVFYFGITRTFQRAQLIEQMSVLDNILITLTKKNVLDSFFEKHKDFYEEEASRILKRVGLYESRHKNAEDLSYGQRKLLEVARALSTKAEIYIFDEPFAGMFKEMVKVVEDILLELKKENKTIILIEHDMDIIRKIVDYCYVLDDGVLIAEGTPKEVLSNERVVEAYLGK